MRINVSMYGSIAKSAGGKYIAQKDLELEDGACKADLLDHLGISPEVKGYLFINAVLYDVPGLITDGQDPLQDGDHVGIFAIDYMWPYQYRDGVRMSDSLKKAMQTHGAMHNVYVKETGK